MKKCDIIEKINEKTKEERGYNFAGISDSYSSI